jgi:type VI protein secretion system component Hcp
MALALSKSIALAVLSGLLAAPAWAAIYVKIDGVDGGVTEPSHVGWIEAHRYLCMSSIPASPVRRRDFSFSKTPDAVSVKLQELAGKGASLGTVQVHVTASAPNVVQAITEARPGTLLEFAVENARIESRRSKSISVDGKVLDLVVLEAENITWKAQDGTTGDGCR